MLHLFDSEEQDLTDSGCSVGHGSLFSWKPQTVMTVWIRPKADDPKLHFATNQLR
jgi:hypothetical protein